MIFTGSSGATNTSRSCDSPWLLRAPARVARPVSDLVRDSGSRRLRRRRPHGGRFFVANVERFARRIAHRVVGPRREAMLAAVPRPGETASGFRDQRAEVRIRQDVAPRGRCRLSRARGGSRTRDRLR